MNRVLCLAVVLVASCMASYAKTVDVSFNTSGSATVVTNRIVTVGGTYGANGALVKPTKGGFRFTGWYADSDYITEDGDYPIEDSTIVQIPTNHTLTARWVWPTKPSANYTVEKLSEIGIPLMVIDTVDGEEPTYDMVSGPTGTWGAGIANATKPCARVVISLLGETVYDSGEYNKKSKTGATVKIRGNTSARASKKPYKLKLQTKADLLCRGKDKTYADKEWVLLASSATLNNDVGFKVNELVGQPWTPAWEYVNVVMNGDYRGLYILVEPVTRNAKCRLNVDENTGYIFERDAYWWNEDVYFKLRSDPIYAGYTFKYPDPEDITADQLSYISNRMERVRSSIISEDCFAEIDLDSFAGWLLGHDLLATYDGGGSNLFLTKYDNTESSKMCLANLWDFDACFSTSKINSWAVIHNLPNWFYYTALIASTNHTFNYTYRCKWANLKDTITQTIGDYLDEKYSGDYKIAVEKSRRLEAERWSKSVATLDQDIAAMKSWFTNRVEWLSANIPTMNPGAHLAVDGVPCETPEAFAANVNSHKANTVIEDVSVVPNAEGGAAVTYNGQTAYLPAYYDVAVNGSQVSVALNDAATPQLGGTNTTGEAVAPFELKSDAVSLGVTTIPGLIYQMKTTDDLNTDGWSDSGAAVVGDGTAKTFEATTDASSTNGFYRVDVTD